MNTDKSRKIITDYNWKYLRSSVFLHLRSSVKKDFFRVLTQLIIFAGYYLLLVSNCFAQNQRYIRVNILQDVPSLNIKVVGTYEIKDSVNQKLISCGRNLNAAVSVYKDTTMIGNISLDAANISVSTEDPRGIIINGRKFRGNIRFIRNSNSRLSVINYIELEDYIKGILYHESSHYWPIEALKAQAVVCRTYAANEIDRSSRKDYDVTRDIYSQVYGGKTSERYRTNLAVDQTKGYVLTYKGKILPAYYHSTCAGHTEDASLYWYIDLEPLKGVCCDFCRDSPYFSWHYVLSIDKIREKLAKAGYDISIIKDIVILGRDNSGRITDLKIASDKNEVKISAKDFRNIVGPNVIKSTNFKVKVVGDDAIFEGFGWGHGVGLCQWGAYFMAKQGFKYDEILKYYYPGSELSSMFSP